MPIWFAAIPWLIGAARVAVPIAVRIGSSSVGRTAGTALRYRKTLGSVAATQLAVHDGLDVTRKGLGGLAFDTILGSGASSASGASNKKSSSGRPKSSSAAVTSGVPRKGGYRPNGRAGGYMPRF